MSDDFVRKSSEAYEKHSKSSVVVASEVESTLNGYALPQALRDTITANLSKGVKEDIRKTYTKKTKQGQLPTFKDIL